MDYDVIVIGSGFGGLTAASLLTQLAGKRVLVLERHFRLGGFNHAFQRKGYHWDVGLHYVGEMHRGGQMRQVMDLVTGGGVEWAPMPHEFEVFHYPEVTVRVPADRVAYVDTLIEHFPNQETAIRRYFTDVHAVSAWCGREVVSWNLPRPLGAAMSAAGRRTRAMALRTTADYLAAHVDDPVLRAVLASQWGDYALEPARSAFAIHAMIVQHYLRGGWYPVGGSDAMTEAIVRVITAGGGEARVYSTVEEILVENGRAVGVRVARKRGRDSAVEEVRAPLVISDAGARATFNHLLRMPMPQSAALRRVPSGNACVTAYLGLREDPRRLGFQGENHWIFGDLAHDPVADGAAALAGRARSGYLSFPSLKDPAATRHTAEVITSVPVRAFDDWRGTDWQKRGGDYVAVKERVGRGLVDLVDRQWPGFAATVDHVEVSTPLTVDSFAGYPSGGFADLATTPERLRRRMFPAAVMPGLKLTGADAMALGIVGAMMGGVVAAGSAMGPLGIPRVMARATR